MRASCDFDRIVVFRVDAGMMVAEAFHIEGEVLKLLADGATNAQIAAHLVIAEGTAKSHVKRILRKLGAGNRVEAASMYLRARR